MAAMLVASAAPAMAKLVDVDGVRFGFNRLDVEGTDIFDPSDTDLFFSDASGFTIFSFTDESAGDGNTITTSALSSG